MHAVLIQPALERHIPAVAGQLLNEATGRQHRQGWHGPPERIAAQPIEPAAAVAQADARRIAGQGGNQQQPQRLGWQLPGAGQRCRDAATIRLQRVAGTPGPKDKPGP